MTTETETGGQDFAAFEAAASGAEPIDKPAGEAKPDDAAPADDDKPDDTLELTPDDELVPDGDDKGDKRRSKPAHVRIAEITREKHEATRRAEAAETRLAALERGDKPEDAPVAADAPARPDPDALNADGSPMYEFGEADPAYLEALTDWKVDARLAERDARRQQEEQQQSAQQRAAELDTGWAEKVEQATERYDDFAETIADYQANEPCPPILAVALQSSDQGADIAYHLAKNPDENREMARLAQTDPLEAARRFGRLEARFETKPEAKPAERRLTEAPEPPKHQVRGAGGRFETPADTTDFAAFERKANGR